MIKILFLFFLLINAAYFYTQFGDTDELVSSTILKQPPLPQGVDKLTLLRERGLGGGNTSFSEEKLLATPATKSIEILVQKSGDPACFTLGPFAKVDTARHRSRALAALGADVKYREVSQRTPRGYWVYLPASKSYQSANRKVKELQKKGLKDLFIMGNGSYKNAISLGLFTQESAAKSRFQHVKRLGLKAVLEIQHRVNQQIWLDMTVPGGQAAAVASIIAMANSLQRVELSQRECQ